ncbi:MAG: (Fe-S)-binding protein [Myxococcales bacterium]|nr:(Fe-S)-binding protein [Myxococcales bacterium]
MSADRPELDRCSRCGECRAVCPVFRETRRETDVARGRLLRYRLARDAGRFSAADREAFSRCLLCGRCLEACKAQVDVPALMQIAKTDSGFAAGWPSLLTEKTLADDGRLDAAVRRYRSLSRWLGRATPDDSGLRLRFALPYLDAGRLYPKPPARGYLEQHTGRRASGVQKLAFFAGCGAGRLLTGVGEAVDRVLAELNLTAAIPEQACCGLAAWGIGATDAARRTAIAWVRSFAGEEYDAILSPCASCTAHLQTRLPQILAGTEFAADAARLAAKVEDFFAWLSRQDLCFDLAGLKVGAHVPCHARREVRDGAAFVSFLKKSGAELVKIDERLDAQCCGMGGSFGVLHPELSRRIGLPKVAALRAAGAAVLVTNCTGCLWQLRDLAARFDPALPVRHPVELLDR